MACLPPPEECEEAREQALNELLEGFLVQLRASGRTEATIKKYRNLLVLFKRCGWQRLAHVTDRSFCAWRAGSKLSGESKNDLLKNTCNFFGWMRRARMVLVNPLEFVEPVKVTYRQCRRALTREQAQCLLRVSPPKRAALYLMALRTGLRRKELGGLTVGDFAFDAPKPFVRVPASMTTNRKEAMIWLPDEVVAMIRATLPDNALPFERVFPCVPRIRTFKKDLERAGIPFEDASGRRIDLHALRVTFCMDAGEVCDDPRVVQALMRHSDIRLTMKVYTDASLLPTAAAVAKLPTLLDSGTQTGTQISTQTGDAGGFSESQAVAGGRK